MSKKTTFTRWEATRHRRQKTVSATKTECQQAEMKEIKPIETFYPSGKIQARAYYNADEKRHRDPKEGPAYEIWFSNRQLYRQSYYVEGKHHRDPKEGPAYTEYDINGNIVCEFYYIDGQQVSGPNKEEEIKPRETFYPSGKIQARAYQNEKGKYHRDPKEGPAFQRWYDGGEIAFQQYWTDGKLHRDPKEGPAFQCWYVSGQISDQQYCVEGKMHRDPKEGPAFQSWKYNGQPASQHYYVNGRLIPAPKEEVKMKVTFYPDGKIQSREYRNAGGQLHRDQKEGPAYECWHTNGQIYIQQYLAEGNFHRDPAEGPAYEERYDSGQIYSQLYYVNGRLHRDPKEGPAYEVWHDNGQLASQQYFVDGKRHRDPKEGPAYTKWKRSGEIDSQSYYVDGKLVTKPKNEMEEKTIPTEEVADISVINNTENENYAKPITISIFIAAIISLLKNNKSKKVQEENILSEKEYCGHK